MHSVTVRVVESVAGWIPRAGVCDSGDVVLRAVARPLGVVGVAGRGTGACTQEHVMRKVVGSTAGTGLRVLFP